MPTLNNEVSILNIASIDNDIKDSSTRSMIAGEEKETYSTNDYDINEFFIWNDRKLYKTLSAIATGDTFVVNSNIKYIGTIASQLYQLFAQSPNSIRELISNIEETAIASRLYHVGEQFLWTDGFLYKVIVETQLGASWVVGTNIELAGNITSQIQTLENETSDMINVLGAKNLLPCTTSTLVINGVTFTVNDDGTVTVNGTANGKATLYYTSKVLFKKGTYVVNGTPNGGDYTNAYALVVAIKSTGVTVATDAAHPSITDTFVVTDETVEYVISIVVRSGVTVSNLTFYPMIRPVSIVDDTYVPYAKTNRELTDIVNPMKVDVQHLTNLFSSSTPLFIKSAFSPTDANTLKITVGNLVRFHANGFLITRYGIFALSFKTNVNCSLELAKTTPIQNNDETLNTSYSGNIITIKSLSGWNCFTVILVVNYLNDTFYSNLTLSIENT